MIVVVYACGINHHTAPVDIRERIALSGDSLTDPLKKLISQKHIKEVAILSTCNRTEIYYQGPEMQSDQILSWFANYHHVEQCGLQPFLFIHHDRAAIQHILRVASGLDSMVLGEPQILGQMKEAYQVANATGTIGSHLHYLFQHVFTCSKKIRTQTRIGDNPISVAYLAVNLAERIFSDLAKSKVLLVGAGETILLVVRQLAEQGVRNLHFANRNLSRAKEFALRFGGESIELTDIQNVLSSMDVVISATSSSLPIIGKGAVETAIKQRKHRPMFMVDLAVPRDIEAEISQIEDVYLYNIDDLQRLSEENLNERQSAACDAEKMIVLAVDGYLERQAGLQAVDTICAYREKVSEMRDAEVDWALNRLQQGKDPDTVLINMAWRLANKFMHMPSVQIREITTSGEEKLIDAMKRLFDLAED